MSNPTASIALLAAHTSGIRITLARAGLLERAQSPLINRKKGAPPPTIYEWTSTLYILQAPLAQAAASVAAGRETTEADAMAWADDIDLADALARLQAAIAAAKRLNVATIAAGGGEEDGGDGPGNARAATAGSSPLLPPPPNATTGPSTTSSTASRPPSSCCSSPSPDSGAPSAPAPASTSLNSPQASPPPGGSPASPCPSKQGDSLSRLSALTSHG